MPKLAIETRLPEAPAANNPWPRFRGQGLSAALKRGLLPSDHLECRAPDQSYARRLVDHRWQPSWTVKLRRGGLGEARMSEEESLREAVGVGE